ncbi:MAG: transporter [Chitinophagaceae bacterium]|nr:transporter [Chitinophagaceae bacterium]
MFGILTSLITKAQDVDPIQTDRPDQTESPALTPKRQVQVEIGFAFEQDVVGGTQFRNITHPNILTKYGVNDRFELRLVTEYAGSRIATAVGEVGTQTISPTLIGLKVNFCDEKKWIPKTSMIFHLGIPALASKVYHQDGIFNTFRFLMQHTLSDRMSLSYNLGAEWDGVVSSTTGIYTLSLSYGLLPKLGAYIELYGFVPQQTAAMHQYDMGMTYLVTRDIQLDVSGGFGLNAAAPDYFIGCGISFRTGH